MSSILSFKIGKEIWGILVYIGDRLKFKKTYEIVLSPLVVIACLLSSGCGDNSKTHDCCASAQKTDTRKVDTFSSVLVDGSGDLDISVQEACSLSITTEEKALSKIITEVKDGTLQISIKGVNLASAPKIMVGMPKIESVDIDGAWKAKMSDIKSSALKVNLDGASNLTCSGTCDDLTADLSGASELQASKLICKNTTLNIDGACKAKIFSKDSLKLDASGAARVELLGDPAQITKNLTEAASFELSGESGD